LPSSPAVTTADPFEAAMTDLSRLKTVEPASPRRTRLMSGCAIRRPESSMTKARPVSPILIAYNIPDQFQVDICNGDSVDRTISGDCNHHVRLGILPKQNGSVPNLANARTENRWIIGHICASTDPVQAHSGHKGAFGSSLVNQRDRYDRRNLLQKALCIDLVWVVLAFGQWKLKHPTDLIAYSADECLYAIGCRPRLFLMKFVEKEALGSIAEPRLAYAAKYERHDNCDKQRVEIF
jgi:hypothetical protein